MACSLRSPAHLADGSDPNGHTGTLPQSIALVVPRARALRVHAAAEGATCSRNRSAKHAGRETRYASVAGSSGRISSEMRENNLTHCGQASSDAADGKKIGAVARSRGQSVHGEREQQPKQEGDRGDARYAEQHGLSNAARERGQYTLVDDYSASRTAAEPSLRRCGFLSRCAALMRRTPSKRHRRIHFALALSTRLDEMPESGKGMTPIGIASSIASLALNGAALA